MLHAGAASRIGLLGPFLILLSTYLVYVYGFSERDREQESAYTVFNHGHRALPGQLRAEEIERQMAIGM